MFQMLTKPIAKWLKSANTRRLLSVLAVVLLGVAAGLAYCKYQKGMSFFTKYPDAYSAPTGGAEGDGKSPANEREIIEDTEVASPDYELREPEVADDAKYFLHGTEEQINPADLLPPKEESNVFTDSNPHLMTEMNFLDVRELSNLNQVGPSLRNSNIGLRSEPAIPKKAVCPWLNSAIPEKSKEFQYGL